MRKNAWTTQEEYDFLVASIPEFTSKCETQKILLPFYNRVTAAFLKKFPARSGTVEQETALAQRIRYWFGNHTRGVVKGTDIRRVLDLSGRGNRRPMPLQKAQAYSMLYYKKGLSLYLEIKNLYRLYKSGDTVVLLHYKSLFDSSTDPSKPPASVEVVLPIPAEVLLATEDVSLTTEDALPTTEELSDGDNEEEPQDAASGSMKTLKVPPFIHFQQTLICKRVEMMLLDEAAAVSQYIEEHRAAAEKAWERPWMTTPKTLELPKELSTFNPSGMCDEDLEMEYYHLNATRLDHSLRLVCEEVKRQSSYRTFFLWGGPSAEANGLDVSWTETGATLDGEQSFSAFLGPMCTELKEKYRQWLRLTYTDDQLNRCSATPPSAVSPTPTSPSQSLPPSGPPQIQPSPTPVVQPSPSPVVRPSPTLVIRPSPTPVVHPSPTPVICPSPTPVVQPTPTPVIQPSPTPVVQPTPAPVVQPSPTSFVQPSPTPVVRPSPTLVVRPSPTPVVCPSPTPVIQPSPTPVVQDCPIATPELNLPSVCPGLDSTVDIAPAEPLTLVSTGGYPKFITPGVLAYLSGVANMEGWSDLLQTYLKFEILSPSRSTTRLPSKQRPIEVDGWLKDITGTHPVIFDPTTYAEGWKSWWIACQPLDRAVGQWPLPREPLPAAQWAKLMNGGKHGIFLFVVSLAWWVRSLESAPGSPDIAAVISDLDWVLRQLTDVLIAPAPASTPTLEVPDVMRSKRKITLTEKAAAAGDSIQKRFRRE